MIFGVEREPGIDQVEPKKAEEFVMSLVNRLLPVVEEDFIKRSSQTSSTTSAPRQSNSADVSFGGNTETREAIGLLNIKQLEDKLHQIQKSPINLHTVDYHCLTGAMRIYNEQGQDWNSDYARILDLEREYRQYSK